MIVQYVIVKMAIVELEGEKSLNIRNELAAVCPHFKSICFYYKTWLSCKIHIKTNYYITKLFIMFKLLLFEKK